MRRKQTARLALAAVLCALAVTIMMLGGLIPAATFCCPILAGFLTVPILCECGTGMALCAWAAVSILSCLLGPDKEAAVIYLFLGWYPVLRPKLENVRQPFRFVLKLLIFNCAVAAVYGLLLFVLIYFPCIATIVAIRNESGSWRWASFAALYTTLLAWIVSAVVYQIGSLFL